MRSRAGRLVLPVAAAFGALGLLAAGVGLSAAGPRLAPAGAAPAAPAAANEAGGDELRAPRRPTVIAAGRSAAGPVLVGEAGRTVYTFSADRPGVSACTGACARTWRPVTSHGGKPQGSAAVPAALVGSIRRADGTYQVTLERRPLYYYAADRKPGDAGGQGRTEFGGTWQVAAAEDK